MNFSLGFLRQYLRIFQDRAAATRVFFPDEKARLWRARTQRLGGGAAALCSPPTAGRRPQGLPRLPEASVCSRRANGSLTAMPCMLRAALTR
jgi:hypothetical protein